MKRFSEVPTKSRYTRTMCLQLEGEDAQDFDSASLREYLEALASDYVWELVQASGKTFRKRGKVYGITQEAQCVSCLFKVRAA